MQVFYKPCALHRSKPTAVAIGGHCGHALRFQNNLAVIVHSGRHVLLEEFYKVSRITEVVVFRPERSGCFVVLITGHNVHRYVHAYLVYNFHHVFHLLFEDVQGLRYADVVCALRAVNTQTGTHTACQKNSSYLALFDCFNTDGFEFSRSCFDFRQVHPLDGFDITACARQVSRVLQLFFKAPVHIRNRRQQKGLLVSGKFVIIPQKVFLVVCFQQLFNLFVRHKFISI